MPVPTTTTLPTKKVYPPFPADIYQCEVTDITQEESSFKDLNGQTKQVFKFEFTIIEDGPYYGRRMWKSVGIIAPVPSDKPTFMWKICSALVGHALTKEEGEHFTPEQLNALIGKQLRVTASQTEPKTDHGNHDTENAGEISPVPVVYCLESRLHRPIILT